MRTGVSLLLLLGLLMCGTSALAAESNDNERFPQNQEALSFALTATPSEAEETEIATASNALELDFAEEPITVNEVEDLQQWLENLDGHGGEVALGRTITIDQTIFPSVDQDGPICIDTGAFGLIYDGGYIASYNLFLTGEGVDLPVLEIKSTGEPSWFPPLDWNIVLTSMDITALGRSGLGGTAVRITSDSDYRRSIAVYESRGQIHSYGRNAVGLALTADTMLETYCLDIDVSGDNSRAVTAINGADLFLCSLSAQGEGASVASEDDIVLDTCILSPEPDHAEIIYRTIKRPTGVEPQIQQYADSNDVEDAVCFYDATRFLLTGGRYLDVSLMHNEERLASIDTSILGPVDFPITLPDVMQGFGLEGDSDFTLRLWVRDPALPVIKSMEQRDNLLYFFSWEDAEYEPGTILWCSEDDEKTWTDISNWDAVRWNDFSLSGFIFQLKADKITKPVSLALETKTGWSNIITLTPGEKGAVSIGPGGDRDGGDRDEQPGGDGGEHGGGSGDTGGSPDGDSSGGGSGGSPGGDSSGGSTGGSSGTITKPESTPGGGNGSGNANGPGLSHGASSGTSHGPGVETDTNTFPNPGANTSPSTETETSPETKALPAETSLQRDDVTSQTQKTSEQSPGYPGSPEPLQLETDPESSPTNSTSPATDADSEALESGSILPASHPSSPIPELALPALVFLSAGGITTCTVYRKKRRKTDE